MSNAELGVCFDLIAKTSQQDYQSSRKGWDPGYKMLEMSDKQMMYLLVRQAEGYVGTNKVSEPASSSPNAGEIIGFLSFRFEPEDEDLNLMRPVQYIYELHLDDRLRGQGLGGHMLRWAEEQARLVKISKTMLTVFTVNEGARRLYAREGYVKDMTSPGDRVTRRRVIKPDYIIMGKEI
ncbi:acyl-CoA N-acyltransferase [Boeremia exigua]|uniref:acyl-CoA N-acyltransferase n=1 Tax=Boeremia exigua TaxID=749465 RepID=UPI001E8E3F4C|nr:acyl-CoA N-acyltransferase [Boeremia exigua]KAH6612767.1 acyl-CoA N-acyltransferase [Boeremia exigua]